MLSWTQWHHIKKMQGAGKMYFEILKGDFFQLKYKNRHFSKSREEVKIIRPPGLRRLTPLYFTRREGAIALS